MEKLTVSKKNIVRDRRGATAVEYAVMVGLVALVAMGAFKVFGSKVSNKINDEGNAVQNDVQW